MVTIISAAYYQANRHKLGQLGLAPSYRVLCANGDAATVRGSLTAPVTITDDTTGFTYTCWHDLIVMVDLNCDFLAGTDLLSKFFYDLKFGSGNLSLRADLVPDNGKIRPIDASNSSELRVMKAVVLPPRTVRAVMVQYDRKLTVGHNIPILCEPVPLFNKEGENELLTFPPHIQSTEGAQAGRYRLIVSNPGNKTITLTRNTVIGKSVAVQGGIKALAPSTARSDYRAVRAVATANGGLEIECAQETDINMCDVESGAHVTTVYGGEFGPYQRLIHNSPAFASMESSMEANGASH